MSKKKKNKFEFSGIFRQIIFFVVGFAVVALISFPLARHILQRKAVNDEIAKMEKEAESLEEKNNSLRKMINYLKSDQFVEEQARLQLGFRKNNEDVYVIKGENSPTGGSGSSPARQNIIDIPSSKDAKKLSNANLWWSYFFERKNPKG